MQPPILFIEPVAAKTLGLNLKENYSEYSQRQKNFKNEAARLADFHKILNGNHTITLSFGAEYSVQYLKHGKAL